MSETKHGVSADAANPGRWVAMCRYHGLRASAPNETWVRQAWTKHHAECLTSTVERKASEVYDAEGNLTAYLMPVDLWRSLRSAILAADFPPPDTTEAGR